jgi:phosphatidylinositol alpha-1,6-mannosyltransferase
MSGIEPAHDLLFTRDYPPLGGGIARWMAAIANRYPPRGLTVSTGALPAGMAGRSSAPIEAQRVDRIDVPVDRLRTVAGLLAWSRRGVSLARATDARFAWCDTIRPTGYAAHWVHRRTGIPYGIMVVGNDILTLRAKLSGNLVKRRIMRAVLGDSAVFVAISQWTAARCRELLRDLDLDDAPDRVRVVPLGTDPVQWHADSAAAAGFRRKRALPDGRCLVTVARLVDYKGIDTAIQAVGELARDHAGLQYIVIGRGPDQGRLRMVAAAAGVTARVHFLDDVGDTDLAAAYSMADVYVGLTRETPLDVEGFGISFAEASACGVPVVAARSGGIPDAVVDGETGLLVPPGDPTAAATAIGRLLDDAPLARRLGAAGRLRVERYLNWDRVVREMLEIAEEFRSVVSRES